MPSLKELYNLSITGPWIDGKNDTQYKIDRIEGMTYLSFQGSCSKLDWIDNFSAWIVPYRNQPLRWYAHAGFVKRWKSVRDEIIELLKEYNCITILGYSQGAAIGLLAFEDLTFNYPDKDIRGHVFGCPRVVSWLSENIYNRFKKLNIYNNRRDIVGRLPPVLFGYRHVKKPMHLGMLGLPTIKDHLNYKETI